MPPKAAEKTEDPKPETEAKTEPPKAAEKTAPEVKELAEKIFIQMCVNQRQGFKPEHHVKLAFQYAQSFIDHQ